MLNCVVSMIGLEMDWVSIGYCLKDPGGTETELAGSLVQAELHAICKHLLEH